jgi:hypothetical protein
MVQGIIGLRQVQNLSKDNKMELVEVGAIGGKIFVAVLMG